MSYHQRYTYIGLLFLIVGVIAALQKAYPHSLTQDLVAALFFLSGAAVFTSYYLQDDKKWWAILPAGVLFTLAVMMILSAFKLIDPDLQSVVFLSGVSLTLYHLWYVHRPGIRFVWARLLALIIAIMAMMSYSRNMGWIDSWTILGLLLLAAGAWLVIRNRRSH
jgi:hypothetical protein